jgi:hypothetical protein
MSIENRGTIPINIFGGLDCVPGNASGSASMTGANARKDLLSVLGIN